MIKNYIFLAENILHTSCRLLSISSSLSRKWFYTKNRIKIPTPNPPTFNNDWEHKLGLSINKSMPLKNIESLEEYQQLPDFLKEAYTYNFLPQKSTIEQETYDTANKLGINEILNPLAFKIIKNTIKIRCHKLDIKTNNKALMRLKGLRKMISNRQRDLKRLRIEDQTLLDRICTEFDIKIVPDEPRYYAPRNPKFLPIKTELRQVKFKKLKSFKEDLEASTKDFYKTKRLELESIRENLKKLNLNIEDVYKEVINDRLEKSMEPIYNEKYGWFEREKELKVLFEKKEAEKKEARERQQRR